jgi:hypothetical protein
MYSEYAIEVPGEFESGIAYLDVEFRKVETGGYIMANGENLRRRCQVFLVGVAVNGVVRLVEEDDAGELGLLVGVRKAIGPATTVVYEATRQYDEMVLKGRMTNARRAFAAEPFFPVMPGANDLEWVNGHAGNNHQFADTRSATDLRGIDAPAGWEDGRYEQVMVHNLRDVAELVASFGSPDAECLAWCVRVLADDEFARDQIFGGEEE